jgi:hypothetical protein
MPRVVSAPPVVLARTSPSSAPSGTPPPSFTGPSAESATPPAVVEEAHDDAVELELVVASDHRATRVLAELELVAVRDRRGPVADPETHLFSRGREVNELDLGRARVIVGEAVEAQGIDVELARVSPDPGLEVKVGQIAAPGVSGPPDEGEGGDGVTDLEIPQGQVEVPLVGGPLLAL